MRATLALFLVLAVTPARAAQPPSVCDQFGPGAVAGSLEPPALDELSGLAASRIHPGVLWAHDDSGGGAELFAMSETGADLGRYDLAGATAVDWEDMAAGGGYLYVGDIGDNDSVRDHVTLYRVPEPAAAPDGAGGTLDGTDTITLRYPDGPTDAESLLVDPLTGDLFILTKSFTTSTRVFSAPAAALADGAEITLTDAGTFTALLATAADVSPDGTIIVVRTYGSVLAFSRAAGGSLADAFAEPSCVAPAVSESQGEAIAFTAAGDAYVTASEGVHQPIHRFAVVPIAASTTTTSAAIPTTTSEPPDRDESEQGSPVVAGLVGAIAVVLVIGALAVRRRARG